jgi:hypothetical protein
MAYGFVMDIPAPIEFYDALHAEIGRRSGGAPDGMLLHLGRATDGGFEVIEVWQSKEQCDRFNADVVGPSLAQLTGGGRPGTEPTVEEFEPRGLIVPSAALAV